MIHEATATGATIEEALQNARNALNAPASADVRTEIIAMPTKKVLGLFGGSPAKARAFYETPDALAPKAQAENKVTEKAAPKAQPVKKEKPAKKEQPKKEAPKADKIETVNEVTGEAFDINSSESVKSAADYLTKVIKGMGVSEVNISAYKNSDEEIILDLDCGEDYGIVIGRRGDTLDAIQYLTRLVVNKTKKENEYSRISINVGNYREKRKNTLRELAKKNSEKVLKYGRNVSFEPMNPYERRIIHTAVQEIEGVTSHSVGFDSSRRVVITLEEGVKPTHPGRGGYNNRGRGGRGGYNRGRNGGRNSSAPKSDVPQRAPRTDAGAEKVSLYGKIN